MAQVNPGGRSPKGGGSKGAVPPTAGTKKPVVRPAGATQPGKQGKRSAGKK